MRNSLVTKYNVPGPRYTSYPTVPYWEEENFSVSQWENSILRSFQKKSSKDGISLYIHLPFCESLCTFCGCNKRITKNHSVEEDYINALLKEWNLYCQLFPSKPKIKEIHLGGGTPTFFSPNNLQRLINGIFQKAIPSKKPNYSFEGHPNNTTLEHLKTLYNLGFRRVSFGIQDFDINVQQIINRVQSFETVQRVTEYARQVGFDSINYDIIYGLPLQTIDSIIDTIEKLKILKPDRIAYYGYAHVPWVKGVGQRKFTDEDLPNGDDRRKYYEKGRELLLEMGYEEIGMDHFSLKTEVLYKSMKSGTLHRNFMGYTEGHSDLMIGLGVSSISDSWGAFTQNVKTVEEYYEILSQNKLPVFRGHILSDEDLLIRRHILNLMCRMETSVLPEEFGENWHSLLDRLSEFFNDGLITLENGNLQVTESGRPFFRNICMAFDLRLYRKQPQSQLFSMTI